MQQERIALITERLQTALNAEKLIIKDNSHLHKGHLAAATHGGGHFAVTIVSDAFQAKSALQRHRMVYAALGDAMNKEIHAISINAYTATEAAQQGTL